jgi:hypothetical protein
MPQTWDEHGNIIASQPQQVWDEHGNSVGGQTMAPGSMQTRPGGPILNSANFQPSDAPQEGMMGKIGRGGLLGMASGAGIPETQNPVKDLLKSFVTQAPPSGVGLLDPTGGALRGAFGLGKAEVGSGQEAYQGVQQRDPEMIAHGVASGVTRPAMMFGGGEKAGEAVTTVPDQMRTGTQSVLGIGKKFIQESAERAGDEQAGVIGKQQDVINQAKIAEPQAFAEADAKYQKQKQTVQLANQESEAGFNQRQQHLDLANQNAQAISGKLPQMHQAARAEASAAYGAQPKGAYDPTEIKNGMEDAAKEKLQGSTQLPTVVAKIMKDIDQPPPPTLLDQASVFSGAGKQGRAAGTLDNLSPKARELLLRNNPAMQRELSGPEREQGTESTAATPPLDAPRIHGFASELGAAASSGSLKPDELSAVNNTRTFLLGRLRKLYDNEGRTTDFENGQAKWKDMANVFENPSTKNGSPIARALQMKDGPSGPLRPDYVQAALSEDKAYKIAQQHLNQYKHLGDLTSDLAGMKTHADLADTLPSQVKLKMPPEGPDYPNFTKFGTLPKLPEGQTLGEFDPIQARKVALKQKSSTLNSGGGFTTMRDVQGLSGAMAGNPMALKYGLLRRLLASGLDSAGLTKWLSKATPEEMQMAKDIPASKVALKKAQKTP